MGDASRKRSGAPRGSSWRLQRSKQRDSSSNDFCHPLLTWVSDSPYKALSGRILTVWYREDLRNVEARYGAKHPGTEKHVNIFHMAYVTTKTIILQNNCIRSWNTKASVRILLPGNQIYNGGAVQGQALPLTTLRMSTNHPLRFGANIEKCNESGRRITRHTQRTLNKYIYSRYETPGSSNGTCAVCCVVPQVRYHKICNAVTWEGVCQLLR